MQILGWMSLLKSWNVGLNINAIIVHVKELGLKDWSLHACTNSHHLAKDTESVFLDCCKSYTTKSSNTAIETAQLGMQFKTF